MNNATKQTAKRYSIQINGDMVSIGNNAEKAKAEYKSLVERIAGPQDHVVLSEGPRVWLEKKPST